MGIWHLLLHASDKKDAETVKSYAMQLNEVYGFLPYDERSWTGLEYLDDGIVYRDGAADALARFFSFAEEIAAHFSGMKLLFEEFNSDNQGLYRYRSVAGRLHPVKECIVELSSYEGFGSVREAALSAAEEVGLELVQDTGAFGQDIVALRYDGLTEQDKMDAVLDSLAQQFPNVEIVCIKSTDECCEAPYASFCIIKGGGYGWKNLDYEANLQMVETYSPGEENDGGKRFRRFDIVRNLNFSIPLPPDSK